MKPSDKSNLLDILGEIERYALEHCDEEADIGNQSPEDMRAHINGIIVQLCRRGRAILSNDTSSQIGDLTKPNTRHA